jgi:hypothetical protein
MILDRLTAYQEGFTGDIGKGIVRDRAGVKHICESKYTKSRGLVELTLVSVLAIDSASVESP